MRKLTVLIVASTFWVSVNAQSLKQSMEARWESDFPLVIGMTSTERVEFIQQNLEGLNVEEQRAYKQAYKAARGAYMQQLAENPNLPVPARENGQKRPQQAPRPKIPGTSIQYDTGNVTGGAGIASQMLGNRFDSALNDAGTACCFPVETSGSITMATFNMVNTQFNSVVYSLYTNIMGTSAAQVTSMGLAGRNTGLNTVTFGTMTNGVYANGTFLAGIWQFDPTMTGLAVDTGTTGGQGFHAISLNDGAMASMLATVTVGGMGANAIFRVSGNVATPVELQNFSVD